VQVCIIFLDGVKRGRLGSPVYVYKVIFIYPKNNLCEHEHSDDE